MICSKLSINKKDKFMNKTKLSVLVLATTLSTPLLANNYESSLTLYKQAALFGKAENKVLSEGRFYVDVPSTIINDSLVVEADGLKVTKKEFKRNDFSRLLKENIGRNVSIGESKGVLKSVNQGFVVLETETGVKHVSISGAKDFQFEKNIPLSSGIYEIYTNLSENNAVDVAYNYLFRGLSWHTNHQLFMDKENNVNYRSDLVIDNKTDLSFENTRLNLMAGDVQIGGNNYPVMRKTMMMSDSMGAAEMSSAPSFESFEGFQKLTYPKPVVVLDNTETHLSFQSFVGIPSEKEYRFGTFYPRNSKTEDVKANMFLILKREDNKDYHFPFTAGKLSVYKGLDPESSTLLTSQSVRDYSEDDDVEISLGQSFDVDVTYDSKLIDRELQIVSSGENKIQILNKTYQFDVMFKNNEPSPVSVTFNFNNSKNKQGEIKLKIDKESERKVSYDIIYEERRRLN